METGEISDIQLLDEYVRGGRPGAFGALVDRYTGLVFSACRRVLQDSHEAEDASQAVFLVLARRAGFLLGSQRALGGWLHATAVNVALHARRASIRRGRHEREGGFKQLETMKEGAGSAERDAAWDAVAPRLDEALASLPAVQREAILLHYYRGLTSVSAALALGCPEATVKTRLRRGLDRLRASLGRRGAAVSAALLALLLRDEAWAAAPSGLAASVTAACLGTAPPSPAAIGLADGVLSAVAWKRSARFACVAAAAAAALAIALLAPRWLDSRKRGADVALAPPPAGTDRSRPGLSVPSPVAPMTATPVSKPAAPDPVNPPFAFLDFGRDGRFDPGDREIPASVFADGEFLVERAEPGYEPPDRPAWLVVPKAAGPLTGPRGVHVHSPWKVVIGADLIAPAGLKPASAPSPPAIPGDPLADEHASHPPSEVFVGSKEGIELRSGTSISGDTIRVTATSDIVLGDGVRLESRSERKAAGIFLYSLAGSLRVGQRLSVASLSTVFLEAEEREIVVGAGSVIRVDGPADRSSELGVQIRAMTGIRADTTDVSGRWIVIVAGRGKDEGSIVLRKCSFSTPGRPNPWAGQRGRYPLWLSVPRGVLDVAGSTLSIPDGQPPWLSAATRIGEFRPLPLPAAR